MEKDWSTQVAKLSKLEKRGLISKHLQRNKLKYDFETNCLSRLQKQMKCISLKITFFPAILSYKNQILNLALVASVSTPAGSSLIRKKTDWNESKKETSCSKR